MKHLRRINSEIIIRSIKVAVGAAFAVAAAAALKLLYQPTAGIITVLSIQNTKKETVDTAVRRLLAFLCAMLLAYISFSLFGYNIAAFGIYMLVYALICLVLGAADAIAMNSVLITHFMLEGNMGADIIINELLLFVIGAGMGIILNLHLHKKDRQMQFLIEKADDNIKGIIERMSQRMLSNDKSGYDGTCFISLENDLDEAEKCAIKNFNNIILSRSNSKLKGMEDLAYIRMRREQAGVLKGMYKSICMLYNNDGQSIERPLQVEKVSEFLLKVKNEYHKDNTVEELLEELEAVFKAMKEEPLPVSRDEFEYRAVFFYILKQTQELLNIKRKYVKNRNNAEQQNE